MKNPLSVKFMIIAYSFFSILPVMNSCKQASEIQVSGLRVEYLKDPIGIDIKQPRFSWVLLSSERDQQQIAYQILVSSSLGNLGKNNGDIWNTGRVESEQSNQIQFQGSDLMSNRVYYWKVKIWDQQDRSSAWSEPAKWSMGPIEKSDWKAKWIGIKSGGPENEDTDVLEIESRGNPPITPSPMLRKPFRLDDEIERAFVYTTALGLYELYINGNKAGDRVLAPEWTDYTKRVQYQTYDVTDLLKAGGNVIGVILADGWYIGTFGQWGDEALRGKNYGSLDRKFLLRLDIITDEGDRITVVTDETWKGFSDGPIRSADMFLGEIVDARKAVPGWDLPGFADTGWIAVEVFPDPEIDLGAQMNEPIRIIESLKPISVTEPDPGVYIFNMGQNIVGWCRLLTNEPEGTIITLRHGEMLDEEGRLYNENLRRAKQEDIFITSGKGRDTFEPRFTYHGFQYVEVTGLTEKPDTDILTGIAISSDTEPAGSFECSNPELNQLWKNILWTQRDNQHSIPTDCPQRDERMGWMGDALVFSQTAIFNMNMAAFYSKWCRDIRDAQSEDGRFADFAPHPNRDKPHLNAPGWADAGLVVPWRVYQNYGDTNILRDQYQAAKKFIDYVYKENPDLIWINGTGNNYGDWLNGDRIKSEDYPETGAEMPKDAFATAYFAYSSGILAKTAKLLGNESDHQIYSALADSIRNVFITEFVTEKGMVAGDNQAAYAIALDFGLLPDDLRHQAVRNMIRALEDYDGRISTGFHSTIILMKELTDWGYTTVAYDLLESHRFPSWLYSIDQGATTIWERWDAYVRGRGFQDIGMNSFNHYSFGSVAEWMYRTILGINPDKQSPGFKKFIMKPEPGGSLTWATGEYNSIHGRILSEWKIENDQFMFTVSIPVNTCAVIHIPSYFPESIIEGDTEAANSAGVKLLEIGENEGIFEVKSGTYQFKSTIQFQE